MRHHTVTRGRNRRSGDLRACVATRRYVFLDAADAGVPAAHSLVLCMMAGPLGLVSHAATKTLAAALRERRLRAAAASASHSNGNGNGNGNGSGSTAAHAPPA